jgi:general stress protein 26
MTQQDLRKACIELMATVPAVYLTTIGLDGHPRIRAMLNLRNRETYPDKVHLYAEHGEDLLVYLATNTSSRKRAELDADPRVGLYYCDPERFFGLSLLGSAEIVDDAPTREAVWADGWERYYSITGRPDDPDYTLVRVLPTAASGWTGRETFRFDVPR